MLSALMRKRKTTKILIAPTNRRLRGRTQKKRNLIRGAMSGQLHQQRPRTSNSGKPRTPLHAALVSRRVSLTQFDLDQITNSCVRFSSALSGVVSIVEDHDDYLESNGDCRRIARWGHIAGDGSVWRLVSWLWVRLWVRRSSAVRLRGSRIRLRRLWGTGHGRNDHYYRDARRSGLHSTTGGVRLL